MLLDSVELGVNIAKNKALKENIFMMVVCIELRIPLFLVGQPGSSNSRAKAIVAGAMQRDQAHSLLFKSLKHVRDNCDQFLVIVYVYTVQNTHSKYSFSSL